MGLIFIYFFALRHNVISKTSKQQGKSRSDNSSEEKGFLKNSICVKRRGRTHTVWKPNCTEKLEAVKAGGGGGSWLGWEERFWKPALLYTDCHSSTTTTWFPWRPQRASWSWDAFRESAGETRDCRKYEGKNFPISALRSCTYKQQCANVAQLVTARTSYFPILPLEVVETCYHDH